MTSGTLRKTQARATFVALGLPRSQPSAPRSRVRKSTLLHRIALGRRAGLRDTSRCRRARKAAERRRPVSTDLREVRAQAENSLGVQLRDARFRDAQHLSDFAQREVLVVVKSDYELLPLRS